MPYTPKRTWSDFTKPFGPNSSTWAFGLLSSAYLSEYILENNIKKAGEYQITDALENMQNNGLKLTTGKVDAWMDCGNKEAMIFTNTNVLEFEKDRVPYESENLILQNFLT